MPRNRRRPHRLVVKHFQVRLALASMFSVCLGAAAFALLVFGPLVSRLLSPDTPELERDRIAETFLSLHSTTWAGLGALVAVTGLSFLVSSHRIAGPLVRFQQVLRAVANGDLTARMRLRDGDWLHEEGATLDHAVRELQRRTLVLQARAQRAEDALARLRRAVTSGGANEMDAALRDVEEAAADMREHLARFTTIDLPSLTGAGPNVRTHTWRSKAGYSIAELLIVFAIAGIIIALAVPLYANALDTARVSRAVAEVRSIDRDISSFQNVHGRLPATLLEAGAPEQPDPWGRPYVYLRIAGVAVTPAWRRLDRNARPLNADFDLYSPGKDARSQPPISHTDSLDDVVRGGSGAYIGVVRKY